MVMNVFESMPFTSYQYYPDAEQNECTVCKNHASHYLLRFKTYLVSRYPFIPTSNSYYMVCSECGHHRLMSEGKTIKALQENRGKKPFKYGKYSILQLSENFDEKLMSVNEIFDYNIICHLKDMKKQK